MTRRLTVRPVQSGPFALAIWASLLTMAVPLASNPTTQAQAASPDLRPSLTREAEIALALSACPPAVAAKAAVYTLGPSGYVKVRDSQNGFTAIVQHALPASQEPQCMDAEGTRTFLPRYLKVAELRAQGKTEEEIQHFVAEGFAKGTFQPPARPGVDYMLSTQNRVPDGRGHIVHFPPHLMFYGPYLTNADIGSDSSRRGPVFVAGEGTPEALLIVPVGTHDAVGH